MKAFKRRNFLYRFLLKVYNRKKYQKYKRVLEIKKGQLKAIRRANEILETLIVDSDTAPIIVVLGGGTSGDVIQITPLLYALKKRFPQAKLILIHSEKQGGQLLAPARLLHQFIVKSEAVESCFRQRVFREKIDLSVECRYVIKYTLGLQSRFCEEDVLFIRKAQREQRQWLPYIRRAPLDNDLLWRAAAEKGWSMYALMAHTAGFPEEDFENLQIVVPSDVNIREKFALPPSYLVVSNSAEWLPVKANLWTKCLPHPKMQQTLALVHDLGITTVLLGIENDPGPYEVSHDLRGKTTILEAAAILKGARLVLGPEGGIVNLAKAVGTRSVVFFGSTPPSFFGFKGNINIEPNECGGCWYSSGESYLRRCPLLLEVPLCTNSILPQQLASAVQCALNS